MESLRFFINRYTWFGMARQTGDALPLEQYWAFTDGVVSWEDVLEAAGNFESCVEQAGGEGFVVTFNELG
ncbi:MAG: hypothetical protein V3S28_09115 [Acidimicrobiia bacterium]